MMWLTDGDRVIILIIDARMKQTEICIQTGMPVRSQTHEKGRSSRQSHHHVQLLSKTREKVPTLMWDEHVEYVIEHIDDLMEESCWSDIDRRYRFLINATKDVFDTVYARKDEKLSKHEFGVVLVHFFFFTAMCFSKSTLLATAEARDAFDRSLGLILESIASRTEAWARILRGRLITTAFALQWNETPRDKRDSSEMRRRVDDFRVFETLESLNDLTPQSHRAPFNALAIASRFKMQEKYEDFYRRIVRASPEFANLEQLTEDAFFDDDFDDFRTWLSAKFNLEKE